MTATVTPDESKVIKIALVGDGGVGKTALVVRYIRDTFEPKPKLCQRINLENEQKEISKK